jgi:hypothetical protein
VSQSRAADCGNNTAPASPRPAPMREPKPERASSPECCGSTAC